MTIKCTKNLDKGRGVGIADLDSSCALSRNAYLDPFSTTKASGMLIKITKHMSLDSNLILSRSHQIP